MIGIDDVTQIESEPEEPVGFPSALNKHKFHFMKPEKHNCK